MKFDAFERPAHAYGMWQAVRQAKALGIGKITCIEFGVAQGRTYQAMLKMARQLTREYGVEIKVIGFDSGAGLPQPLDYRDLPYYWQAGQFPLATNLLPNLLIGDVSETVPKFVAGKSNGVPIGFIAFDLDYYSATKKAFEIFNAPTLPRVFCYFDDVIDDDFMFFNEYTGELLAIREFNEEHGTEKLTKINGLAALRPFRSRWPDTIYVLHKFAHPLYIKNIGEKI